MEDFADYIYGRCHNLKRLMSINRISATSEDLDEIIHNVKSHQDHHCLLSYKL